MKVFQKATSTVQNTIGTGRVQYIHEKDTMRYRLHRIQFEWDEYGTIHE
jgi:hypothetical protein